MIETSYATVDFSQQAVDLLEEILEPDYVDLMQVSESTWQAVAEIKVNPRQVGMMTRASNTVTRVLIQGMYFTVQGSMEEIEAKLRGLVPESREANGK